jgi:hypothetical protein
MAKTMDKLPSSRVRTAVWLRDYKALVNEGAYVFGQQNHWRRRRGEIFLLFPVFVR